MQDKERIPNTHFSCSYNIGITDISFDAINNDAWQHQIIYDTEDGILETRTYKFLSIADYLEGPIIEVRSYDENASVFVRPSINNEPADLATRNQWWRIEFHHSEKEHNDETVNYYTIKNILSGFVLTAGGVDLYTKIVQRKFVDGND